jgi:hypothetical protein
MKHSSLALLRLFTVAGAWLVFAAVGRAQTILPDATAGQAYSFQLTTNPPQPPGAVFAANGLPVGLAINSSTGWITGTTVTVGAFNGQLSVTSNSTSGTYPYQITVDPATGSPAITSPGAAVGTVGTPFSYTLAASNNPLSFNIAQLPPGLMATGAQITGTPTTRGLYFTSVSANNPVGQGGILVIMWTINAAGPLPAVTSGLLISGQPGTPFAYTITATNSPTSFTAAGLPTGLSLNTLTGAIGGTPAAAGISAVVLTASNIFGSSPPVNLTLTIGNFSAISSATVLTGTVGGSFSYGLTATNSPSGYNLAGLPAGLSFNSVTGVASGTPATAGNYTLTASANNALGTGVPTLLSLSVTGGNTANGGNSTAPAILLPPLAVVATVGSTVQFSVTAVGSGPMTYAWALNGSPISGAIGPTLTIAAVETTEAGSYTATVTNSAGSAVSAPAALTVSSLIVPPAITSQPFKTSASVGTAATFTVGASGSFPLSYQWEVGGTPIAGAYLATFTLPSVALANAGTYSVVVSNLEGSVRSVGAALTVSASPVAPIFQYEPTSTSVNVGGTASFSVGIVGSSPITYQWFKGGAAVAGATAAGLTFPSAQSANAGTYSVTITNPGGTVTSANAILTVTSGGVPVPVAIIEQPVPVSTTVGGGAAFTVGVTGDAAVTYQWRKNQAAIAGATGPTFTLTDLQNSDAATYDVLVANGFSATISFPTPLTVSPVTVPSRLTNVSVRGFSGTGDQALVIGFVVAGSGNESLLVRAVGPTLAEFGLTGLLADPQLAVYGSGEQLVASNDNWGGGATLATAFQQAGAFPLPTGSLDSAVLMSLPTGAYTAVIDGANNGTGVALLEAYDVDTAPAPVARCVNVSALGLAGAGSNSLTIGFVITGATSKTLLIRSIGPTLASFGIGGSMANPQLTIFDSGQNALTANAGWAGTAELTAAFNYVGAFPLPPTSQDAALLVTLAPGVYSAVVAGANGSTGIALIELYEMP